MRSLSILLLLICVLTFPAVCQQPAGDDTADDTGGKRILWIIPNFRTSPTLAQYKPLNVREKFTIASEDSFDRGTLALAALFAGDGQLTNSNPSFGQGTKGYARYFGTAYGDFVVGDFMTEGIFPTFLHQDPRYFRRGRGSFKSRLAYSAGQIFLTHGDSGHTQFNFSEVLGNSAAVGVSMSWYPENRNLGDAVSKLGVQLGVDMASNILKEFVPDLTHKLSREHADQR